MHTLEVSNSSLILYSLSGGLCLFFNFRENTTFQFEVQFQCLKTEMEDDLDLLLLGEDGDRTRESCSQ